MGDMGIFLTMFGIVFGGFIVWIVYTNISNNMGKNSKNIANKAELIIKKDMSSKYARCTFYMNNDYDNGYSQSEWLKLFKEDVIDKELDKDSEKYAEAVAPFINAIVVDDTGFYARRGTENLEHSGNQFNPGVSDEISMGYFVEPYEYVKDKENAAKYAQVKAQTKTTVSYDSSASDLRKAKKRYEDAVFNHKRFKGSSLETFYELQEKEAYAALLSAQAKYDSRK